MLTCHLVIAGPSHHRPRVEDESVFSSGNGILVPQCFCLLQEPQLQQTTLKVHKNRSAREEYHPLNTHIHVVPQGLRRGFLVISSILGQAVSVFVLRRNFSATFPWGFLTWSSSLLEGFFHQALGKRNKEGAIISCSCYGMTVIPGIGMALYFLKHFCECHLIMRPCEDHGKDLGLNIGSVEVILDKPFGISVSPVGKRWNVIVPTPHIKYFGYLVKWWIQHTWYKRSLKYGNGNGCGHPTISFSKKLRQGGRSRIIILFLRGRNFKCREFVTWLWSRCLLDVKQPRSSTPDLSPRIKPKRVLREEARRCGMK